MNKRFLTIPIAFIVVLLVIIGAVLGVGINPFNNKDTEATDSEQSESDLYQEPEVIDNRTTTNDTKNIAALQQENSDIYAWITVPGTTIDYPILQSEEDNYYLEKQVDGTDGLPGSIYTNAIDGKDFSRSNTIIYGHNMKNGSYFGQLHLFEEQDFFDTNKYVYIYLSDRKLTYSIIIASTFNDEYLPDVYDFSNQVGAGQFLNDLAKYASGDDSTSTCENISMGEWNQIITLSTCVSGESEKRYVVVAKLEKVELYE